MKTSLTRSQIQARRYFFSEYVALYFSRFGFYPAWHEFKAFFTYASRKAVRY